MTPQFGGDTNEGPQSASLSRRDLLAGATLGVATTAGCLGVLGDDGDGGPTGPWSQARFGPANRSFAPHLGPGGDLEHAFTWTHPDDSQDLAANLRYSTATVGDDRLFAYVQGLLGLMSDEPTELVELIALDRESREVDWRFEPQSPAGGAFSPIVGDEVVVCYDGATYYGVDVTDGTELWSRGAPGGYGPPSVADGTLYATENGRVTARSLEDGSEIWQTSPDDNDDFVADHTPAVTDDAVLASADGELVAVDRETGDERWRTPHEAFESVAVAPGDPVPLHAPVVGEERVFAAGSVQTLESRDLGALVAFDIDGTRRWQFDFEAAFDRSVPREPEHESGVRGREFDATGVYGTPALADGTLYGVGLVVGTPKLLAVDADSGELQWDADVDEVANHVLVGGDVVFVYRGSSVEAYDRSDGSHLSTVERDDVSFYHTLGAATLTEDSLLVPGAGLVGLRSDG